LKNPLSSAEIPRGAIFGGLGDEWTAQQFGMVMSGEEPHGFLVHDNDRIHSEHVDRTIAAMGLTILKTPVRAPQANAFCERLIGTIRRECLDWMIPLNERHLRHVLREWVAHYNRGRPHASSWTGHSQWPDIASMLDDHRIGDGHFVIANPILGGLHHEYRLEPRERVERPTRFFAHHSRFFLA
jgi:putative transposase